MDCGHDNIKSDMWFFPSMYLFRQGMELGIKALICDAITNKGKIQQVFLSSKHEYNWLKKYLESLEMVDAKSDLFRFPLEDEFLSTYRNEFLDIVDMANSMLQAYGLIQKCLVIQEGDKINRFDRLRSDEFLQFANHGIGNCYLWESITGDGFHKLVLGYGQTAEFLFMECTGISKDEKIFPILFY